MPYLKEIPRIIRFKESDSDWKNYKGLMKIKKPPVWLLIIRENCAEFPAVSFEFTSDLCQIS